jgi:hypothetical protein
VPPKLGIVGFELDRLVEHAECVFEPARLPQGEAERRQILRPGISADSA